MEYYHWAIFTHAMNFYQQHASLKKPNSKTFLAEIVYYTIWFPLATSYQQNL
jgi:hypothetical protein